MAEGKSKGIGKAIGGAISAIGSLFGGRKRRRREKAGKKAFEGSIKAYEAFDISNAFGDLTNPFSDLTNPYADTTNPFANIANAYEGMTNPYEKLRNEMGNLGVSTEAAEFQSQQQQQGLAQSLDAFRGAAGGSGTAALAQSLAQEQRRGTQQIAADIARQEIDNTRLAAQGAQQLGLQTAQSEAARQQMVAGGSMQAQQLIAGGEQQRQLTTAAGEQQRQQLTAEGEQKRQYYTAAGEESRQTRELERKGDVVAIHAGEYEAATAARGKAHDALVGGLADVATGAGEAGAFASDRRLKKNIKLIDKSLSGLNIYIFEYIDKIFGEGLYQGVMSDEIPQYAVIKGIDGYDRVNYNKIDIEFKKY